MKRGIKIQSYRNMNSLGGSRIHMFITAEYKQPLPHASAVYNLDAVYGPLHVARYLCQFMILEWMGPIILFKMMAHFTPNLTLCNGLSRIHTAFSAPVSLGVYVPLDKIKLRR